MEITAQAVKSLREETGAGIMDCKRALSDAQGDASKAKVILREKGFASAAKKSERETGQGVVEVYVHGGGRIGVIVELNCETDFVARTDDFKQLAREVAMQIAAMNPRFLSQDDVPGELKEREQLSDQEIESQALLTQSYIRDPGRTIEQLVKETIAKTGENIRIRRFNRYELGK